MTLPLTPAVSATAVHAPGPTEAQGALTEAARQFEAIFLKEVLKSVEKCGSLGGGGNSSGQNVYGSMIVDAVATAVAQAGGLGLADVLSSAWESSNRASPLTPTRPGGGSKEP